MCNFECSNCEKEQECRDLRPLDFEEETEKPEEEQSQQS